MRKFVVNTKDRQRIAGVHDKNGHDKVVVLAHGFLNNKDVHLFREIVKALGEHYDVVAFDFRGHGQSSGLFTWTSKECSDLQAVLAYVSKFDYDAVGLIGFSLGAAVCLIEAAHNEGIKTMIAVSAPDAFWKIDYRFWEPGMLNDLRLNLGYKGRGKGVRPGNPLLPKIAPISIVERIAPRPVLFIHGSDDWLIKPRHSRSLFKQARQPKQIEIIPKGGHAEKLFDDHPKIFMELCLNWFKDHL